MAMGSKATLRIHGDRVPMLPGARQLAEMGCFPGAAFRNQEFVEESCSYAQGVDYTTKMLLCDAQTSGGLLMCIPEEKANALLEQLKGNGYPGSAIIGEVTEKTYTDLTVDYHNAD
jgi:selenide,water dikinase